MHTRTLSIVPILDEERKRQQLTNNKTSAAIQIIRK